jgi:hypothetical protein
MTVGLPPFKVLMKSREKIRWMAELQVVGLSLHADPARQELATWRCPPTKARL